MVGPRPARPLLTLREVFYVLTVFLAGYVLLLISGLLTPARPGLMRTLHGFPSLVACGLIMIVAGMLAARAVSSGGSRSIRGFLFFSGAVLMAAGVLVSSQFRFEGSILLTEGQTFGGSEAEYIDGSVYRGRSAVQPRFSIAMTEVQPRMYSGGTRLADISATMLVNDPARPGQRTVSARRLMPALVGGYLLSPGEFGYAPYYRIAPDGGKVFDEAFVMLRLFPPGREDSFRTIELPHTFYVKYFPSEPSYEVRVSRNLDLIVPKATLRPGEPLDIGPVPGPLKLAFLEVRRWSEIRIVRDPGLLLMLPGAVLVCLAALARVLRSVGARERNARSGQ